MFISHETDNSCWSGWERRPLKKKTPAEIYYKLYYDYVRSTLLYQSYRDMVSRLVEAAASWQASPVSVEPYGSVAGFHRWSSSFEP